MGKLKEGDLIKVEGVRGQVVYDFFTNKHSLTIYLSIEGEGGFQKGMGYTFTI